MSRTTVAKPKSRASPHRSGGALSLGADLLLASLALLALGVLALSGQALSLAVQLALAGLGALAILGLGLRATLAQRSAVTVARDSVHSDLLTETQQANQRLEDAINALPEGFAYYDHDDKLVVCNQRYRELYPEMAMQLLTGVSFEQTLRFGVGRAQFPEAEGRVDAWIAERLERHRRADGTPFVVKLPGSRWVRINERRTAEGALTSFHTYVTDLMRREQELVAVNARLAESEARIQSIFESAVVAVAVFDEQGRILSANASIERLFGFPVPAIIGQSALMFTDAPGGVRNELELAEFMADRLPAMLGQSRDVKLRHRDGHILTVNLGVTEARAGEQRQFVAMMRDISQQVAQQQALRDANDRLEHLSSTDALTGLANRRKFEEQLQAEWMRGARQRSPLALLVADVDHFKRYNDHYGHVVGDACLQQVARLLGRYARRSGDLAARYGGEEFALLLPGLDAAAAMRVAQACVQEVLAAQIPHANAPDLEVVSLSIGVVSLLPSAEHTPSHLIEQADKALYRAKAEGRGRALLQSAG